jgi:hypothetical protein
MTLGPKKSHEHENKIIMNIMEGHQKSFFNQVFLITFSGAYTYMMYSILSLQFHR